jgi:glutamate 5-kinase
MKRLGWRTRPKQVHELQAAAAVGQMGLAQMYESRLSEHGASQRTGVVDPCRSHRSRALPERPLDLDHAAGPEGDPVINENDTVVNDEIRFGDNDTLGALVATWWTRTRT